MDPKSANLWHVCTICDRRCRSLSMGVLWEAMIETTNIMILASMEGGIRPRVSMSFSILGLTHMEYGTRPCLAWTSDQMGVSVEHSFT